MTPNTNIIEIIIRCPSGSLIKANILTTEHDSISGRQSYHASCNGQVMDMDLQVCYSFIALRKLSLGGARFIRCYRGQRCLIGLQTECFARIRTTLERFSRILYNIIEESLLCISNLHLLGKEGGG